MIEHAPPSVEPLPSPADLAPGTPAPNVLRTSGRGRAAEEVQRFIVGQGRDGYPGLTWESGDERFVVSGQGMERRGFVDPSTGELAVKTTKHGRPIQRRGRVLEFFRERRQEVLKRDTPTTYIEVYKSDQLVRTDKKFDGEFDAFLDSNGDDIGRFWLQPEQVIAEPDLGIPIDVLSDPSKSVTQAIRDTQSQYGLHNWEGLTYTRYGETMGDDDKVNMTILKDMVMPVQTFQGHLTNERFFVIQVSDHNGEIERKTIAASKVKKDLNGADRDILNIHFRVVKAELEQRQLHRSLGQISLMHRATLSHEHTRVMELQPDDAINLLIGSDIYSSEALRLKKEELKKDPELAQEMAHYADALCEMAAEIGTMPLLDLAARLKDNYLLLAKKSGLPIESDTSSWMLWDMAKQYYLANNPELVSEKDSGFEVGEVIGYGAGSRAKQQELIDHRLGALFDHRVVKRRVADIRKKLVEADDGSFVEKPVKLYAVSKDQSFMHNLRIPPGVEDRIEAIMGQLGPEDPLLDYAAQTEIGRLLRESFMQ